MDIKNLEQHIVDLRNPTAITLGVKVLAPLPPDAAQVSHLPIEKDGTCHAHTRQQFRNKNKNDARNKGKVHIHMLVLQ